MTRRSGRPWLSIGSDAWRLGFKTATVVGLRTLVIARGGPEGEAESRHMVAEKVEAGLALSALVMTGRLGLTPASTTKRTLAHLQRKVTANRRRLTKG